MSNNATFPPLVIEGYGTCRPPDGITPQEAERLAREADEQYRKENQ